MKIVNCFLFFLIGSMIIESFHRTKLSQRILELYHYIFGMDLDEDYTNENYTDKELYILLVLLTGVVYLMF